MTLDRTRLQLLQKDSRGAFQNGSYLHIRCAVPCKTGKSLLGNTERLRKKKTRTGLRFRAALERFEGRRRLILCNAPFPNLLKRPERIAILQRSGRLASPLDRTPRNAANRNRHRSRLVNAHRHSRQAVHVFRAFS